MVGQIGMRTAAGALALALGACAGTADRGGPADLRLSYAMPQAGGEQIAYRVYLPAGRKPGSKLPLVVVLHGYSGNADSPFEDAGGLLQREADRHGFIIASPNGYNGMADYGANLPLPSTLSRGDKPLATTAQTETELAHHDVLNVLDRVTHDYPVNTRRIYLMGNSMGMTGVLHLASTQPQRWCAISASGGPPWPGYPVARWRPLAGVLLVHGGRDDRARLADTQGLAERARAAGIDAQLRVVPEGTHGDAWVHVLPETFDFFAQRPCK